MASRLSLATQAKIWRGLENIGMGIERWTGPIQATPIFTRTVTISAPFTPGSFLLHFYAPPSYHKRKAGTRYPALVNFHGGGFTIGDATDDARWAHEAMRHLDTVVVSVAYRLAPEFPYPVAVQDGACALRYIAANSDELAIDPARVATCGFSAGGTLCITAPMLYSALLQQQTENAYASSLAVPVDWYPQQAKLWAEAGACKVTCFAAFYPAVDSTLTRAQRRATNPAPAHNLSMMLTGLFDASYLPIPDNTAVPTEALEGVENKQLLMNSDLASFTPQLELSRTASDVSVDSIKSSASKRSTASRFSSGLRRTLSSRSGTKGLTPPTSNPSVILTPSESEPDLSTSSGTSAAPSRTTSSRASRPYPVQLSSSLRPSLSRPRTEQRPPPYERSPSRLSIKSFRSHQSHKKQRLTEDSAGGEEATAALFDPFLSPSQAPKELLQALLPDDCIVYTCEYDMLQAEGEAFATLLAEVGKRVCYKKVAKVPHAWDKMPGVVTWGQEALQGKEIVDTVYEEVCGVVGHVLGIEAKVVGEVKNQKHWTAKRDGQTGTSTGQGKLRKERGGGKARQR